MRPTFGDSLATNPVTNLKLMNGVAPVNRYRMISIDEYKLCEEAEWLRGAIAEG